MFKTNVNRPIICNSEIIEWDIKSANTSLMREYRLADPTLISKIESLNKNKRNIYVGNMMRNDKVFSGKLESAFNDTINQFLQQNNLCEYDIISIKRDAVFVSNHKITHDSIGEYVKFIPKNSYHAFILLKNIEFYFSLTDSHVVDVKGINDETLKKHEKGILEFLFQVVYLLENESKTSLHMYLREFVDAYKRKELPFDYYRHFDDNSKYIMYIDLGDGNKEWVEIDEIDENTIDYISIKYNYENIILPLIQIII